MSVGRNEALSRHRVAGVGPKMACMALLDDIGCPDDVRKITTEQAEDLAEEIRTFLIDKVSRTGGHLGPNLGIVELTIALHRVFDSPHDPIIFDTGHQSYVHKILTGRANGFEKLRQRGGLSGYPSRAESVHDWVENSHASTSLSWAEGMATGFLSQGEDRTVVAVIGDGALTGGMAWEALDSIADQQDLRLVIVVNDNGRSYTPTVGGLANQLAIIRTDPHYEEALDRMKRHVADKPLGKQVFGLMHAAKVGVKDALIGNGIFSDLGIKYLGPVDGHDISSVERALELAKRYGHPVIVHVMTTKGKGFAAAEANEEDHFHAVGKIDPVTGASLKAAGGASWTQAFAGAMVELGEKRPDVVGVTAAMLHPVGLAPFAARHPDRVFDVGIAEQHAVTSAAGMAVAGLHPVVALYSTFLNRAFDQLLMDAGLHHEGVTIVLDRAGITGTDGASHNGMWDMALLAHVPGLRLAAPRDEATWTRARAWALRLALAIGLVVLVFYGGMLWGVLPGQPGVSWQAHLWGAVGGVLAGAGVRLPEVVLEPFSSLGDMAIPAMLLAYGLSLHGSRPLAKDDGYRGLIAVAFGIAVLVWPGKTAVVVTGVIVSAFFFFTSERGGFTDAGGDRTTAPVGTGPWELASSDVGVRAVRGQGLLELTVELGDVVGAWKLAHQNTSGDLVARDLITGGKIDH